VFSGAFDFISTVHNSDRSALPSRDSGYGSFSSMTGCSIT